MKAGIDIGKLIKSEMEKEGRKANWLSQKINYEKSKITRIYQCSYINTDLLIDICIHLEVDLFVCFSEYVCEQIRKKKDKK